MNGVSNNVKRTVLLIRFNLVVLYAALEVCLFTLLAEDCKTHRLGRLFFTHAWTAERYLSRNSLVG